jgi:AraC family transcriptional regulator
MGPQLAVTAGTSRFRQLDVPLGFVSANRFPAGLTLPAHSHPQATVAVVLAGGFMGSYRGGERECDSRTVLVEPAGEEHRNRFGPRETKILTLSLHVDGLRREVETAADRFRHGRDAYAGQIARRAADELDRPDDVTPLAVEAAALELLARITRTATLERRPTWLGEARSLLHDRYAESLSLAEVAAAVGVEPDRVARGFRRAFGEPLSSYLRRIRVDAAAVLLASTDLPISRVAADVGFADQSHLTRWFAWHFGTTPGRYRAAQARDRGDPGRRGRRRA